MNQEQTDVMERIAIALEEIAKNTHQLKNDVHEIKQKGIDFRNIQRLITTIKYGRT